MGLSDLRRNPLGGYLLAIGAAVLTTVVVLALRPFIHPYVSPPFLFVVLLVARTLGSGPAVAAAAVSVVAFALLLVTPEDPVITDEAEVAATVVFLGGLVVAWVAATIPWSGPRRNPLLAGPDPKDVPFGTDERLAILARELKTSAAATRAALHEIDAAAADESAARAGAIIRRHADHVARLAGDVREATRSPSGRLLLDLRPLDLAAAAEQGVTIAMTTTTRHVFTLEAESVWIEADALRVQCVILTLLEDAMNRTAPDGSILVRVIAEGPAAVLEVLDTGLARAGEWDTTSGLAVVRHLVALHGGTVVVASPGPRSGIRFTVSLPRIERPAPPV
jgi:signal transduction histidine kinase